MVQLLFSIGPLRSTDKDLIFLHSYSIKKKQKLNKNKNSVAPNRLGSLRKKGRGSFDE